MFALISPDQSIYVRTLMDTKRHKHFRLLHVDLYNSIHIDMGQYNVDVSCHTDTSPSCPSIINNGAWMSRLQKWFSCVMLCDNVYIPHLLIPHVARCTRCVLANTRPKMTRKWRLHTVSCTECMSKSNLSQFFPLSYICSFHACHVIVISSGRW